MTSNSSDPSISTDGGRVAFYSTATALVAGDTNSRGDVFVRDLAAATTARGSDSFTYDQVNRLISASVAGTTETATYDGDGVRVSRQVG